MISTNPRLFLAVVAGLIVSPLFHSSGLAQTALDTYVAKPDASYGFTPAGTVFGAGYTGYEIDLTSQTWRNSTEVLQSWKSPTDPTQGDWLHKMTITQPDTVVSSNTAILYIGGGSNPNEFSLFPAEAAAAGLTFVHLPTVPNQSMQFAGEGFTRQEDGIIAKTFANYLDGGDDEWPLLLPMVKSAVRAMDATQTFMATQGVAIDNFIIYGESKRGWATWLTAAVEADGADRVSAIIPAVFDVLNIDESMAHHRSVYEGVTEKTDGGYTQIVSDYVDENIFDRLDTPRGQELLTIVDPYEYRDRLDIPKYIINSTGDQYFAPDSSQFYFDDLIGENYLRYVPNADHSLNSDATLDAIEFAKAIASGATLPEFSWTISDDGTQIILNTVDLPEEVKLWQATNLENRDFRIETFGANWTDSTLVDMGGGQYVANISAPATGATAFMMEMEYIVNGTPITFTTEVSVVQVPEPSSAALLLFGIALIPFARSRVRREKPPKE